MSNVDHTTPNETEMRNLLPGYVLGILEAGELLAVDQFLAENPRFWEEVHALEQTTAQLAYSAPAASPPAGSKEAILAEIKSAGSRSTVSTPAAKIAGASTPLAPARPTGTAPSPTMGKASLQVQRQKRPSMAQLQGSPAQRSRFSRLSDWWSNALGWKMYALATTAAIAIIGALFSQTLTELQQRDAGIAEISETMGDLDSQRLKLEEQLSLLTDENSGLVADLETLRVESTGLEDEVTQLTENIVSLSEERDALSEERDVLNEERDALQQTVNDLEEELNENELFFAEFSTGQQIASLRGNGPAPDASGSLWVGSEGAYLLLAGLEPLPENQTYQLWLIPDGEDPVSSGLITLVADSNSPLAIDLSVDLEEVVTVGLSIEPAGGSDSPTVEDIVLLGART